MNADAAGYRRAANHAAALALVALGAGCTVVLGINGDFHELAGSGGSSSSASSGMGGQPSTSTASTSASTTSTGTGGTLNTCDGGGGCGPKPVGAACAANDQCASNVCGGDGTGHCCSASCTSPFYAGDAGDAGDTCGALDCDGTGACVYWPLGTICGSTSCSAGMETGESNCNGAGQCLPGSTTACGNYGCNGAACATSCTTDTDCAGGPCDVCSPTAKLCLAPLGVGHCVSPPCQASAPGTCGPGTFTVGEEPTAIAFDGTNMWVVDEDNVVIEVSPSGTTLGTFPVGNDPEGIAFDGTNMWVVNSNDNTVTELSPSGTTLGPYAVGGGPQGIAFDGMNMWVANYYDNTVTKLSPSGATLATFPAGELGETTFGIAFDGTHMWVTNENSTVTEL
jgi:hypothetical protein